MQHKGQPGALARVDGLEPPERPSRALSDPTAAAADLSNRLPVTEVVNLALHSTPIQLPPAREA
jgi:hypothetical protein